MAVVKTDLLMGDEGFLTAAAKFLEENLYKMLTNENGVVKWPFDGVFSQGMLPLTHETISIDYNDSVSLSASKESNEDLEIGVCLSVTETAAFKNEKQEMVNNFNGAFDTQDRMRHDKTEQTCPTFGKSTIRPSATGPGGSRYRHRGEPNGMRGTVKDEMVFIDIESL
ncbi:hypothetical protein OSB04_014621 [Centaurea solstitialis]|uniref:Uncharacterized protein n=1 Tax=Centaurea solstitialis TaxID=347529 RepID=A0AA38TAU8_9ASTR|nr:hypothetical protein OSB04_014621 [Centaurea solstitialis]